MIKCKNCGRQTDIPKNKTLVENKFIEDERRKVSGYLLEIDILQYENKRLREDMQEFCDKVERGEARSVKTYTKFKTLLTKEGKTP